MILMIDNYDSFVYNLVHYFEELDEEIIVKRNDEITIDDIKILNPEIIVLSPGPCSPNEAGICIETVKYFKGIIPILGICLGHQTIGQVLQVNPKAAQILMNFGMGCLGCPSAQVETIEQACEVHGLKLEDVLAALNEQ